MRLDSLRLASALVLALATSAAAQGAPGEAAPVPDPEAPIAEPATASSPEAAAMPALPPPPPAVTATLAPTPKIAKNALYAEVGGNGAWYSVNYERYLRPDAAVRVGLMYMSITATASSGGNTSSASATWTVIPIMFQYLGIASGSHALELGAGLDLMYFSGMGSSIDVAAGSEGVAPFATATIGYRYANPNGGFLFKAGYTPLIAIQTPDQTPADYSRIFHWGGMSFGYRF